MKKEPDNKKDLQKETGEPDDDVVFEEESGESSFSSDPKKTVFKLKEKLKECEDLKNKYLDDLHRAKADFVNARRQDEESNKSIVKFANENLISDIIPVLDSFDMAFSNREAWNKVSSEWRKGVEYIYSQLLSVLESYGVSQVDPKGKEFDPQSHESLESVEVLNKQDDHKAVEVVQKGYNLYGKTIRTAKVKVGEYKG